MSTLASSSSKVVPWSYLMEESAASTNSIKCLILLDPYSMKLWNNKPFQSQKLELSQPSTREQAFLLLQIRLEVNTTPTFPFHKISTFHQHFSPASILSTLFLTRLTKLPIEGWQHILLECILRIVHNTPLLKILL